MKRIAAAIFPLVVAFVAGAQEPAPSWKLEITNKLLPANHRSIRICGKGQCQRERQEYLDKLIKVCLYRDETSRGWFSRGTWKATVNPQTPGHCKEIFFADATVKTVYLEIPITGNRMSIRCSENERAHGIRLYPPSSNYDVCASDFFISPGSHSTEKILQVQLAERALQEAQFSAAIEQHLIAKQKQENDEAFKAYKVAFENANTLEEIKAFEKKYKGNDPEDFIGQLALGKRTLEVEEYRRRYSNLQSIQDFQAFIKDFSLDDPDERLPEVRQRLENEQQKDEAKAKTTEELKIAETNKKSLQNLERQIRWCKSEIETAQKTIEREQEIGLISGSVNRQKLHFAGTVIVECREQILKSYKQYRLLGGTRPLAEIQ